jgi:diguanylate cyclase (GGDEF)-like protein
MTEIPDTDWLSRLSHIDFAFQPIVNIHTGVCYGYEALLRNYEAAGFKSIDEFFDQAYLDNALYPVELALREKAIEKFSRLEWKNHVKLFFNLDNRVLDTEDYKAGNTVNILKSNGLSQESVCFEISEKHELQNNKEVTGILNAYRTQGFKIAVDDCGTGFSGLKLLYYTKPDFIKIDRFFVQDITNDPHKRLFVSSIVNLAHVMGSIVVAEGVETKHEYYSCRNIGCDLIQGYLVQHPELNICKLQRHYEHIRDFSEKDRRSEKYGDKKLIYTEMEYIEPVLNSGNVSDAFERFKAKKNFSFFPVVNNNNEPMGIISEKSFKDYTFSRFGAELLRNPAIGKNLNKFIAKYPIADIHTPVEKILEIYSHNENMEGIIIVDDMKYKGFLSARSLLKVLNEKNVAVARDQNPLTKLPGNTVIHEYVSKALHETDAHYFFVYFDLDNFKPFNDTYGFRRGDRVIMLFSELLRTWTQYTGRFAGHIGGDDFFMGVNGVGLEKVCSDVMQMTKQFRNDAESFYDPEAIEKGYIVAKDRNGNNAVFPLLTVSAVILALPAGRIVCSSEEISNLMAKNKKTAKNSPEKLCIISIGGSDDYSTMPN